MNVMNAALRGRVLILGGTGEALGLARALAEYPALHVITSLAGRTSAPRLPAAGAVRQGGFNGAAGLARYLEEQGIGFVADATHPFAAQISDNARTACEHAGVGRALLGRRPWSAQPGDRWTAVANVAEAVQHLAQHTAPRHVFLTIGSRDAALFLELHRHHITMRMIEEPQTLAAARAAHPHNALILERGPFNTEREQQLFRERGFEVVVTKNAGGDAAWPKIAAARALGLGVIMVQPPAPPPGTVFYRVDELARYIAQALGG